MKARAARKPATDTQHLTQTKRWPSAETPKQKEPFTPKHKHILSELKHIISKEKSITPEQEHIISKQKQIMPEQKQIISNKKQIISEENQTNQM